MTRVDSTDEVAVAFGQTVQAQVDVAGLGFLARVRARETFVDEQGNTLLEVVSDWATQTSTAPDPGDVETLQLTRWGTASRTGGGLLDGATVEGDLFASMTTAALGTIPAGVTSVAWRVDGVLVTPSDLSAPWDMKGGSATSATAYDTTALSDGDHTITVDVTRDTASGGDVSLSAAIVVSNGDVATAPQNLTASGQDSAVLLNWDAPPSVTLVGWSVYRDGAHIADITDPATTTYTATGLVNGTSYEFAVRAILDEEGALGDAATVTGTPVATSLQTMFVSGLRLQLWRSNRDGGVYVTTGDVSTNSPGDWDRIVGEKNTFMANPAAHLFTGPAGWRNIPATGCIPEADAGGEADWLTPPERINSAMLFALVQKDATVAAKVRDILVQQVNYQDTKFADRARYCLNQGHRYDNVLFAFLGEWLSKVIVGWDFLDAYEQENNVTLVTTAQRDAYKAWVLGYAQWNHHYADADLASLFVDRIGGDYTLTGDGSSTPAHSQVLYDGAVRPLKASIKYNNRGTRGMRGAGLAAVAAGDATEIATNKRYWEEVIKFGHFTNADAQSDFERWTATEPNKGWKYATEIVAPMITVAEALKSTGDTSLYDFSTSAGTTQTSGGPKTLLTAMTALMRYVSQFYSRKAGGNPINPAPGYVNEVGLILGNSHYSDTFIRQTYLRENAAAYPSNPSKGKFDPWRPDGGVFPAGLFLFAGLDT